MALTIAFDAIPDSQLRKRLGKHQGLECWSFLLIMLSLLTGGKSVIDHL